jgi:hypothetical protein
LPTDDASSLLQVTTITSVFVMSSRHKVTLMKILPRHPWMLLRFGV